LSYIAVDSLSSINESLSGTKRVEDIVRRLKDFSHSDSSQREHIDINQCIDDAIGLVWNKIKYKCDIKKNYGSIPKIFACSGELNQVFVNIIMNAVHSIEDKGVIEIETSADSEKVFANFTDTGAGVAEENLNKLFDPFFTTKDVGSGTGLGLYVSHGLIEKHKGSITVKSKLGSGSTFTISLPVDVRNAR
jgi:signal transduction histidine kinase